MVRAWASPAGQDPRVVSPAGTGSRVVHGGCAAPARGIPSPMRAGPRGISIPSVPHRGTPTGSACMAAARKQGTGGAARREQDDTPGVDALVARLSHPLAPLLQRIRAAILAADPAIGEGIKWNSPSFHRHGWFATINCRRPDLLQVVFHCGAKVQAGSTVREAVDDPRGLLAWPSVDRALVAFASEADFATAEEDFRRIVAQWAAYAG